MRIHEVAEKTGLTAPTIRYYEEEGLLDSRHVHREGNNYRDYCEEAINQLNLIKKLQSLGFSLGELRAISQESVITTLTLTRAIEIIREKTLEIERKKDECEHMLRTLHDMLDNKMSLMKELDRPQLPPSSV